MAALMDGGGGAITGKRSDGAHLCVPPGTVVSCM